MLGCGEWFLRQFLPEFPGACRCRTKLTLRNIWFHSPALLNQLVADCNALEFLSLMFCGFHPDSALDPLTAPPALLIDATQSRLQSLVCHRCHIGGVQLVQAPALQRLYYNWISPNSSPISLGSTPSLKSLSMYHYLYENKDAELSLSQLLGVNAGQIKLESLLLDFNNGNVGNNALHLMQICHAFQLNVSIIL